MTNEEKGTGMRYAAGVVARSAGQLMRSPSPDRSGVWMAGYRAAGELLMERSCRISRPPPAKQKPNGAPVLDPRQLDIEEAVEVCTPPSR